MKQWFALLLTTLTTSALLAVGPAIAGYHSTTQTNSNQSNSSTHDGSKKLEKMSVLLKLSPDQKQKMQTLMAQYKPQMQKIKQQMRTNKQKLRQLFTDSSSSISDIKSIADDQGKLFSQLIVLRFQLKEQVNNVLTPAQKTTLKKWMQQRHQQHKHHHKKY